MAFHTVFVRGRRLTPVVFLLLFLAAVWPGAGAGAAERVDLRTFVTSWHVHGMPYAEARAYGTEAVPELLAILDDPGMEVHWAKVVYMLGVIGDPGAAGPLMDFLRRFDGEISVHAFRAALRVLPALGYIAQSGDENLIKTLTDFTHVGQVQAEGLHFGYARYRGAALGEVLGRMAIQGLGASGQPQALQFLNFMIEDKGTRDDWRDNLGDAIQINGRLQEIGPERLFGGQENGR